MLSKTLFPSNYNVLYNMSRIHENATWDQQYINNTLCSSAVALYLSDFKDLFILIFGYYILKNLTQASK